MNQTWRGDMVTARYRDEPDMGGSHRLHVTIDGPRCSRHLRSRDMWAELIELLKRYDAEAMEEETKP